MAKIEHIKNKKHKIIHPITEVGAVEGLSEALAEKQETLVSGENIRKINGESILGRGEIKITGSGPGSTIIIDGEMSAESENPVQNKVITQALESKQDELESGVNIKTINGKSIIGEGNLFIREGDPLAVKFAPQELTEEQKAQARANINAASLEDINSVDFVTAASLPTASESTMGHIYLIGPDADNNYDRYFTQESGGAYSWTSLGSTQIDLSDYAKETEVSQLEAEVHNMSNKFYGVFLSAADLPNDVAEPGYAYVGSSSPFAIYNFDGNAWTDSETTMDSMYGPSVNPFKGFFNSATDLNAAYPTPTTGQYAYVNQGGTPAVAHIYFSNGGVWSDSGFSVSGDQESDFTRFAKSLLIQTLSKVAWTDANAQVYLSALEDALMNDIVVDHITAVFEPGSALITDNALLDELRQYLTVTAFYNNGTSGIVTTYTLAGTISVGTQTMTVDYLGAADTFTVNVLGNYAERIDNWMYHPNNSVAQYDSRGYIALKCSTATDLNNYNCYVADIKKTLWSTVNGKTIKVRIKTNSTTDGMFGLGIYKNSSITSIPAENARRAGLSNLVLADDGYYEQTFVCDISNFTIGSLTPETSATFGVWCYSRSTSNWTTISDVQIFDVTP